jgi:hypothetical protein
LLFAHQQPEKKQQFRDKKDSLTCQMNIEIKHKILNSSHSLTISDAKLMSDEDPENAKHEFAFDNPAFKGNLQIIQFPLSPLPPPPPGWMYVNDSDQTIH